VLAVASDEDVVWLAAELAVVVAIVDCDIADEMNGFGFLNPYVGLVQSHCVAATVDEDAGAGCSVGLFARD